MVVIMEDRDLIAKAFEAAEKAWAPYSRFRVGAAVLLEDGTVVCGNNQENRVYPLGSCAERVAVNYARANYPTLKIEAIAIVSPDSAVPVSPCGGCREVLAEGVRSQHGKDIRVIMVDRTGYVVRVATAMELLPFAFEFK